MAYTSQTSINTFLSTFTLRDFSIIKRDNNFNMYSNKKYFCNCKATCGGGSAKQNVSLKNV